MAHRTSLTHVAAGIAATMALLFVIALLIGAFYSAKQMILLGLFVVVGASITTIMVSYRNITNAQRTDGIELSAYIPEPAQVSANFLSTYGLNGKNTDPLSEVRDNVAALRSEFSAFAKANQQRTKFIEARVETLHGIHKYHQEISLPRTLANGMGSVIVSSILTIIGSVFLAIPTEIFDTFSGLAGSLRYLCERMAQSM